MKIFFLNGRKVWLDEKNLPDGAVACGVEKKEQEKTEPAKEVKIETKAKKAPANKARKAGSNK